MRPQGIQRKRVRGYDMQAESRKLNGLPAISVCRPGKYSNPFKLIKLGRDWYVHDVLSDQHSRKFTTKTEAATEACSLFEYVLKRKHREHLAEFLAPLKGHNLACFCRIGEPCHRDVLLRLVEDGEVME